MTSRQLYLSNYIEWGDIKACQFDTDRQLITVHGRNGDSKQFTLDELRVRACFDDPASWQAADLKRQIDSINNLGYPVPQMNKEPSRGVLLLMMEEA